MSLRALQGALLVASLGLSAACGALPGGSAALRAEGAMAARGVGALRLVTLPEAGDQFFLEALRSAKRSIHLQVYLLTHEGVEAELAAARRRGVDVQVMLEPAPFNSPKVPAKKGAKTATMPANQAAAAKLDAAGVPVTWTPSTFQFSHAKAVTIDHEVTFVSTANFTRSGLNADGGGSREYVVEDANPTDVAEFEALFHADRARTTYVPSDPNLVVSPTNSRAKIFALIAAARRTVDVQVEAAGDPALDALIASKCHEGVKVRALFADLSGAKSPSRTPNGQTAKAWQGAGAQVRYEDKPHLHGKAVVVDGQALYVGSENLTTTSLDQNRELGLIVTQPDVVSGVASTFEHDWASARATSQKGPSRPPKPHKRKAIDIWPFDPAPDDVPDVPDDSDALDEDPV